MPDHPKPDPAFQSDAWLLLGIINSLPGRLQLKNGRLRFAALNFGTLWKKDLKKLEQKTGIGGLAQRLENDQATLLFDVDIHSIQKMHFPFYYFSCGMHLTVNDLKYRFSFIRPNNTRLPSQQLSGISSLPKGRYIGKKWKELLKI